jgi:hypothetical protein
LGERLEDGLSPFGASSASARCSRSSCATSPCATTTRHGGRCRALRRALSPPARARDLRGSVPVRALFLSLAHTDEDVDRTVEAVGEFRDR